MNFFVSFCFYYSLLFIPTQMATVLPRRMAAIRLFSSISSNFTNIIISVSYLSPTEPNHNNISRVKLNMRKEESQKKCETKKQLQLFTCLMYPAAFEYGYSQHYHMNRTKNRKNAKFCSNNTEFFSLLSLYQGLFLSIRTYHLR